MHISIVTPALNEAATLPLRRAELLQQTPPWEWIVADGGSDDGTTEIARDLGARVVVSPRGRGGQLNTGAAFATGDVLLFLHADTALPRGALDAIRRELADASIVGGNFTFAFDDDSIAARFLAWVYATQQRFMRVWFGDSAIFCRRAVFTRLGGFPPDPIMEDLGFVDRLRGAGKTIKLELCIRASPRRYRRRLLRTIFRWTAMLVLYRLGIAPERLARWYPPHVHR